MKKRYGLIMLLISLIIMTLYPGRFTTFAIFDNSYVHSPYSFLFGFILFFFSLGILMTRGKPSVLEKKVEEVALVETSRGSRYEYLPNNRTQRFKKVEGKKYEPQDAIVFVPDYQTVQKIAPKDVIESGVFGENEAQYEQELQSYVQGSGGKRRVFLVNQKGRVLTTNEQIANEKIVFLALQDKTRNRIDLIIPVSKEPKLGYYPFDTRTYREGERDLTERHIGNKVVKIGYKSGKVIS